jgi:hypothetical protein
MKKIKFDNFHYVLLIALGVLSAMLIFRNPAITRLQVYDRMLDMTYIYGGNISLGYSIPLTVSYIQNDTVYVVTKLDSTKVK